MTNYDELLSKVIELPKLNLSEERLLSSLLKHISNENDIVSCSFWLKDQIDGKYKLICKEMICKKIKEIRKNSIYFPLMARKNILGELKVCYKDIKIIEKKKREIFSLIASYAALVIENKRLNKEIKYSSNLIDIDGLTKLYNHKYFQESLKNELEKSRRFNYSLCLLMLDIDHFKEYNDTFGHPAGDMVLIKIAEIIKKNMRSYDIVARYGGEEIAIILPHAKRNPAFLIAERMRKEIQEYTFADRKGVTVSIGLANYPINAVTKETLIKKADDALYLAKEEGRNRTCFSLIETKERKIISFCPPAYESTAGMYYKHVLIGIKGVAEDIGNIDLIVNAPKTDWDVKSQVHYIKESIKQNVSAILLCYTAILENNMNKAINLSEKNGIPVFCFNTPKSIIYKKITSSVGFSQRDVGKKVADYLVRLLRREGEIAVLEGIVNTDQSRSRKKGFTDAIKSYPGIKVVESIPADWRKDKAKKLTKTILRRHPHLGAIFALNDEMALGAVEAIEHYGKEGKIFVIGVDGIMDALTAIREKRLTATLYTNPVKMGQSLMRTVVRNMIGGEKIKKFNFLPLCIVDFENIEQYIIE